MLMYDIVSYTLLFLRFFANTAFGFLYFSKLLTARSGKGYSFFIFTMVYLPFQIAAYIAFERIYYIDNIIYILLDIGILLLIQRILFKGDLGRELFAALSFAAGKELFILFIVVLDYHLLSDISDGIMTFLAENASEMFIRWGGAFTFISFSIISIIAIAAYAVLLQTYLNLILKGLNGTNRVMTVSETMFLILPSLSSLCITIILKMMNTDEALVYYSIYDRFPNTRLWVPLADFLLICTVVASAMLFGRLMRYNEERLKRRLLESQIDRMEKEISEIRDIYSDIRGLRHDMHNHLSNISLYIKSIPEFEDKAVEDYIGQMRKTVDRLDFPFDTGNPVTDIIISRRTQEAEKKKIELKADFIFPGSFGIDAFDMGIILDNALENSIAACEAVAEEKRIIRLRSYVKGSLMFIETDNRFCGEIKTDPDTGLPVSGKSDSGNHGLGLSNIRRCAKKYMGDIDIEVSADRFILTVMLRSMKK